MFTLVAANLHNAPRPVDEDRYYAMYAPRGPTRSRAFLAWILVTAGVAASSLAYLPIAQV